MDNFFTSVLEFLSDLYEMIIDAIANFFIWLSDLFMSFIEPILDSVNNSLPNLSSFWSSIEVIQPYVSFINSIIPLDMVSRFIVYYFVFVSLYLYFKLIIRMVKL